MNFNLIAFLLTMVCCIVSWSIAGKTAMKNDYIDWWKNLNHPKNSFMLKYMNIVGVIFYLVIGFVLYHLFVSKDIVPIFIAVGILLLNGFSPFFMYKTKNFKLIFIAFLSIPILVTVLIFLLIQSNIILSIMLIVYFLWLIFDMSYFYRLMKFNM